MQIDDATPRNDGSEALPLRTLGDLQTTALGMGVMNVVHAYGPPIDRAEAVRLVRYAFDRGIRFFDTAEIYGPFVAEEITGEALGSVRDESVLCTKFGFQFDRDGKPAGLNSKPDHIRSAVEGSLRRLGTNHIDLLYQHRIDRGMRLRAVSAGVGLRSAACRFAPNRHAAKSASTGCRQTPPSFT